MYPASQPGGGNPVLRRQLKFLSQTIHSLDFVHMRPNADAVKTDLPKGASVRVLASPGQQYLVYIRTGIGQTKESKQTFSNGELSIEISLPAGHYSAEWLETKDCTVAHQVRFTLAQGTTTLGVPAFSEDIALTVRKR